MPSERVAPLINLKKKRKLSISIKTKGKFNMLPLFKDQNNAKTKNMNPPKCKV